MRRVRRVAVALSAASVSEWHVPSGMPSDRGFKVTGSSSSHQTCHRQGRSTCLNVLIQVLCWSSVNEALAHPSVIPESHDMNSPRISISSSSDVSLVSSVTEGQCCYTHTSSSVWMYAWYKSQFIRYRYKKMIWKWLTAPVSWAPPTPYQNKTRR